MSLEEADYEWAAKELDCDVAAIKAIAEVESAGSGFFPDGQPKILFEAHHFSKMTGGQYDKKYPNISSAHWNRTLYAGGIREHNRLDMAVHLDREAALKSTSWGKFQIMGFNWKACGYATLEAFISDMHNGEFGHLKAFVGFIKAMRLTDDLRAHNWKAVARNYNGPGYEQNDYDGKLRSAYDKFKVLA